MRYESILDAIGHTPLVRINHFLSEGSPIRIYGKLEWLNPCGSVKDRTAYGMIKKAEDDGLLEKGGTVVESTSGNLGVALSMICAAKKYQFICVVDPKIPKMDLDIMKAFGARIDVVHEADENGGYQKPRINRVREILGSSPGCINLDQYNNPACREAHYNSTGPEIYSDMDGIVDVLVGAVSTGGHLCGTAQYLKEKNSKLVVIGVEPEGSVIFGGEYRPYRQSGTGLSFRPSNYVAEFVDIEKKVSDDDAFMMVRELAKREGLLVGGSSGGVFYVAMDYVKSLKNEAAIVALFPDGGAKYYDSIFSDK